MTLTLYMPKPKQKKQPLSDKELIEKYEAGKQPIPEIIDKLLSKPNPNAPVKKDKSPG